MCECVLLWCPDPVAAGQLHWDEFKHMAEVNLNDGTGLVPHRLYHVALFLMFDSEFRGIIGVDDAMEMLFTRCADPAALLCCAGTCPGVACSPLGRVPLPCV